MPNPVQRLLYILALATDRELARQLQFAHAQNQVLRNKLPKRIAITPADRAKLLKFGRPLGPAIKELITIVVPLPGKDGFEQKSARVVAESFADRDEAGSVRDRADESSRNYVRLARYAS